MVQAEDNDKYHRADIDGKYNDWGIPYVDFRVDQSKPSYNTVIYGHNMGDGTMFGYLQAYKKLSYYPISITTISSTATAMPPRMNISKRS